MYAEGDLLAVEPHGERDRAQTLQGSLRFLKVAASAWVAVGLFFVTPGVIYANGLGFPIFGDTLPLVLLLGLLLVPVSGLYVAIVGSRADGPRTEARFRRGALRSLLLADWIPLVWSATLVFDPQTPSVVDLFLGAIVLVTAAWLGAYVMGKMGARSVARGLLVGALFAELPAIGVGLSQVAGGEPLPVTLWVVLAGGPVATQLLLFADFGLIQLEVPDVEDTDVQEGSEDDFEVVETRAG